MIPLISLVFSFDFTEASSPQRLHGEPSLSQRRALAVAITSLRQLVESKGAVQSIHKCASDHPHLPFSKSSHPLQKILASSSENPRKPYKKSFPSSLRPYFPNPLFSPYDVAQPHPPPLRKKTAASKSIGSSCHCCIVIAANSKQLRKGLLLCRRMLAHFVFASSS